MRLGDHLLGKGQRALGPKMADANRDDAALDAEIAARAVDCVLQGGEPSVVGNVERLGPLRRAEHLDIDRAFGRRTLEIGVKHVTEVLCHLECCIYAVIGVEEAQEFCHT